MRQNKNSPEDPELQNPVVLTTRLIDTCILISDGEMRDPGLRHHYSALKTVRCFLVQDLVQLTTGWWGWGEVFLSYVVKLSVGS